MVDSGDEWRVFFFLGGGGVEFQVVIRGRVSL